ncbi:MAG: hypothetical protein A2017_13275 [Lentisphaerae bacterium GWF2_44_16]|nr:MAG: hypothetical protein A2017_13275 [Lentisphaerae bacterium GWF2_44_16]
MKNNKFLFSVLFLLLSFPFYLTAGDGNGDVKIPLKLYSIPDPKNTDPFTQADVEVFRAFCRKFPNIKPFKFSGITIQGAGMDSAPLLAIAGGNSPDVLYVNFRQSDTYIQNAFLYPLDEFVQKEMTKEELDERIPKPAWPVLKREGPTVGKFKKGEHIWAMPYGLYVRTLLYRKDLFEKVGLDPDKPPKNWDELYEYAKRIADPAKGYYGMSIASGQHAAWDWMAFLWSAGGDSIVRNDKGEWVAVFDTDAAVTSLEFYFKLVMERWVDADNNKQMGYVIRSGIDKNAWNEGRVGMMVSYLDDKSIGKGMDPSIIGMAPFPLGPTGLRGTEINCTMMGMFSDIKGRVNSDGIYVSVDKIRDAAWKYIHFYDSDEAKKIRIAKFVELGYGKMMNPIFLRKFGYTDYIKYVPKGWEEVFVEALKCGKPEPYGKNCQFVYEYMTFPLEDIAQRIRQDESFMKDPKLFREEIKQILHKAVDKTNRFMIGKITPDEQARRNFIAGIVSIVMLTIFCFVVYRVWNIFSPKLSTSRKGWGLRRYLPAYVILLPAVISILLWFYVPMLTGSKMVFMDYRFVGESPMIGLKNIADVLFNADWWNALWNTLRYMTLILCLGFWPPIVLAILLHEVSHGKIVYRMIYYLPAVMSGLVVIYLWQLFFESSRNGLMNQLIVNFLSLIGKGNIEPVAWLEDPRWAMLCCVIPSVWASMGPGCLIYLAALKGVPPDLYEAADIDGCSFLEKIRYIVVPSIKALIVIQFIGAFIAASQSVQMILVMTYGRANTEVGELKIFKEAYMSLKFGTAISMAWMLGVTMLMFTVYQLKMLSRVEFKSNASEGK